MAETTVIPGLDFIRFVLESIVDDRDELQIEGKIDDLGVLITIQTSARDMGKLIGKSGQTVKALRTLVRVVGSVQGQRINLKILEPQSLSPTPV